MPSSCQVEWSLCRLGLDTLPVAALAALLLATLPATASEGDEDGEAKPVIQASELPVTPPVMVEPAARTAQDEQGGVQAFTGMLETRKRQLVTSYYLYRGPAPTDLEMDAAIGAIDRLILQDYSLEDVWSTIFHIMISEPELAHRQFEEVIPPNIQRAHVWRQASTPVKVVIEESYPEFDLLYKQAQRRKRTFGYVGAAAFVPAYTLSIAFGSAEVGSLYDQAHHRDMSVNAAAAFLPIVPLVGPILTQAWIAREADRLNINDYDAGAHLVGAVWGTLMQALGMTAIVISLAQPLPDPFGDDTRGKKKRRASVHARITPTTVGLGITF